MKVNKNGAERKLRSLNPLGLFLLKGKRGDTFYSDLPSKKITPMAAYYQADILTQVVLIVSEHNKAAGEPKINKITKVTKV